MLKRLLMLGTTPEQLEERLTLLNSGTQWGLVTFVCGSIVLAVVALMHRPTLEVLMWWGLSIPCYIVIQGGVWWQSNKARSRGERLQDRLVSLVLGELSAGICAGLAFWLFAAPEVDAFTIFLSLVMLLVISGSAFSSACLLSGYFALTLPILLPMIVHFASSRSAEGLGMAAASVLALVFNSLLAREQSRLIGRTIDLQDQNEVLVRELKGQTDSALRAQKLAEEANQAKSRFFAAASHDLRQPLHAMGLLTDALHHEVMTSSARQRLTEIDRCVQALDGLFSALLEMSRLDAGIMLNQPRAFALDDLFQHLWSLHRPIAENKGLRLVARKAQVAVQADPLVLERILSNFLSNALRYTSDGGVLLTARPRNGSCSIEVWDTGEGIHADDQQRVFQEFYQVGNSNRDRRHGLGLGLATVKKLAALAGWPLELQSRPGRGSVFKVSVPKVALPVSKPPLPPSDKARGGGWLSRIPLLCIEDDELVAGALRTLLLSWEAEPLIVRDAESAYRSVKAGARPALILSDLRLPGDDDGLQVIQTLRRMLGQESPALLLTGDVTSPRCAEARSLGISVLHKPVRPLVLRNWFESVTDRRPYSCDSIAITSNDSLQRKALPPI
jgi:signal transduction histidine kinase/CheY-like chemotaxis protein